MDETCVFCKIIAKTIPADIIAEDGAVIVFKDTHPKAPVHFLVVPKEHIESIVHLQKDHSEIISKMIYKAKVVAEKLGLSGYRLVFNVGREGGQVIDHLHLHVLGGWTGSAGHE